jgi:COP9 signalosome complex subunit 4
VLSDACRLPPAAIRQVFSDAISSIFSLPPQESCPIGEVLANALQPRALLSAEELTSVREQLSDAYAAQGLYSRAARALAAVPLESASCRASSNEYRARAFLRIAMLYLEDDEIAAADSFLNRATSLLASIDDPLLHGMQKASLARILDTRRKFLEACIQYYQLSTLPSLSDADRAHALQSAAVCAVLAKAGPRRTRMLATLVKDERSSTVPAYKMLERVYANRIVRPQHVEEFTQQLKEHQKATSLDQAVLEHNISAAATVYANLRIDALARLLGVDVIRAERAVTRMVMEDRLDATVDQVAGIVRFEKRGLGDGLQDLNARIANVSSLLV